MANQYTASFDHIVKEKFGKSAQELLLKYAEEGVTYDNAAKLNGVQVGTIRKWCNLYNIALLTKTSGTRKSPTKDFRLLNTKNKFQTASLNKDNFLSRKWLDHPFNFQSQTNSGHTFKAKNH